MPCHHKEMITRLIECKLCGPERILDFHNMIDETINEDITYQSQPLDLRNQRTYAVKVSGNPCALSLKND